MERGYRVSPTPESRDDGSIVDESPAAKSRRTTETAEIRSPILRIDHASLAAADLALMKAIACLSIGIRSRAGKG
jgi:hypothetical protein